jgi:hypothetical protein
LVIETTRGTLVLPPGYRCEAGESLEQVLRAAVKIRVEEFELDLESMD